MNYLNLQLTYVVCDDVKTLAMTSLLAVGNDIFHCLKVALYVLQL